MVAKINDVGFTIALPRTSTPQRHRSPVLPRRPTLHVRIKDKGEWHRLMLDPAHKWGPALQTSCEQPIVGYYGMREESLEEELCHACFTPGERRIGAAHAIALSEKRREEAAQWEADRAAERERAIEEGHERMRKYKTGQSAPIKKPDDDT